MNHDIRHNSQNAHHSENPGTRTQDTPQSHSASHVPHHHSQHCNIPHQKMGELSGGGTLAWFVKLSLGLREIPGSIPGGETLQRQPRQHKTQPTPCDCRTSDNQAPQKMHMSTTATNITAHTVILIRPDCISRPEASN